MIKLNKAVIHRFVQIFLFFCGIVLVHLLALGLTSSSWGDVLRSISQQDIEQMLADIERYFFSTLLHLYIISYLLFACLPVKIRCSRWWLRGIYFVIFYFLNICIYFFRYSYSHFFLSPCLNYISKNFLYQYLNDKRLIFKIIGFILSFHPLFL